MQASEKSPSPWSVPPRLGRYEIVGGLGHGGMASVYLGRVAGEAGFQRLFAIKVLHPHLAAEPDFVTMMLDEAQLAARLHHPNVVPVVDLGTHGGFHYIVMEYVEGCTLHALLAKHRRDRPPRLVIPIVLDALSGLHAAHSLVDDAGQPMNLVHRDVSPHNILVGVDGTARITDFGIARAESRINSTRPGQLKGKVAYMSPEQLKSGRVDCRSDVFSMGVLLWSELTGRRLFAGMSEVETMSNVLHRPVERPSQIGLRPPSVFDAICLRALERDPDERFATAEEMEDALRNVALAHRYLGTRREVSEWVTSTFGAELAARRSAVRTALLENDARSETLRTSSGLHMMPSLGAVTSSDIYARTPSGTSLPPVSPVASAAPSAAGARIGSKLGVMAIAVVIGALAAWSALEPRESPTHAATAARPGPAAALASPRAEDAHATAKLDEPAVVATPAQAQPPSTLEPHEPSASAPPKPAARAERAIQAPTRAAPSTRVRARTAKRAVASDASEPARDTTPEPQSKPVNWDDDSPLPPP